jgi:glutamyl-tRNA synthetase
MNGQYLSLVATDELIEPVRRELARRGVSEDGRDLRPIIDAVKARSRTVLHLADQVTVRLHPARAPADAKGEALIKKMGAAFAANLDLAAAALETVAPADWTAEPLLETLKQLAAAHNLKLGDAMQPIRVALTGSTVSEPVNELLVVVGREASLTQLREGARQTRSQPSQAAASESPT